MPLVPFETSLGELVGVARVCDVFDSLFVDELAVGPALKKDFDTVLGIGQSRKQAVRQSDVEAAVGVENTGFEIGKDLGDKRPVVATKIIGGFEVEQRNIIINNMVDSTGKSHVVVY